MNFKPTIPTKWKSIFISIAIYSIALLVLAFVKFKLNIESNISEVYLEFKKYEKQIKEKEFIEEFSPQQTPQVHTKSLEDDLVKMSQTNIEKGESDNTIDSTVMITEDSIRYYENWIDSMVINNSNLYMLKYALQDQIKNSPIKKSDSLLTVETIRKSMQNYFRSKYPTPLYKFGPKPQGIPIESIVNIFVGKDTVDVERIKKYLKLNENK